MEEKSMEKSSVAILIAVLVVSTILPAHGAITARVTVSDDIFAVYKFEDLEQAVYDQAITRISAESVPQAIVKSLEQLDLKQVQYGFGPEPLVLNNDTRTVQASFFLSGSDIISYEVDRTTMKRTYELRTEWMKFQIELSDDLLIDFSQRLTEPVSEWQKTDATTFYHEDKQADAPDILVYLNLPTSAVNVRAEGDTILFDMLPSFEDQVLNSPFIILAGLAIALVLVLIYRKVR